MENKIIPTHLVTIFKPEKIEKDDESLLVLIPDRVLSGAFNEKNEFVTAKGDVFQHVLEAYKNNQEYGYEKVIGLNVLTARGAEYLIKEYGYEECELPGELEIFQAYVYEYTLELDERTYFYDLNEIAPTLLHEGNEEFFTLYGCSIDRIYSRIVNESTENLDSDLLKILGKEKNETNVNEEVPVAEVKQTGLANKSRLQIIKEIKKYILAQDEPVEEMVSAIYNPIKLKAPELKRNILIYGPSGSGKTALVSQIAKQMGLPFYKADAASFSASGYEGESVSSVYSGLYLAAGRDMERLQAGAILFLDEIDKLVLRSCDSGTDVKKQVYNELLTLLDHGGYVNFKISAYGPEIRYNKENLIVISGGSFAGAIEAKKKMGSKIGFGETDLSNKNLTRLSIKDFVNFGLPIEFLGRQQMIVPLKRLTEENLYEILTTALDSPYVMYQMHLAKSGINLTISEANLRMIANKAYKLNTGARSLRAIFDATIDNEINDIVDALDNGEEPATNIEIPESVMVKRLERYYGE